MRRSAIFTVAVATCGMVLSACGTADDEDDNTSASEETTCEPTQVEGDPKVGLAYDVGGRGDASFNDAAYAGLEKAVTEYGVTFLEGQAANDEDEAIREDRLRGFVEDGYNTIIGVGFAYSESVDKVAPDYPDVAFAVVDGFDPTDTEVNCNVAYLTFAENEGSYLAGAAAALQSQTGKLGFVGGVDNDLIQKFEAGFVEGATAADPDVTVDVTYIEKKDPRGFNDPSGAKAAAAGLYAEGADIVFHASGNSGSGVFDAAVEAGKLSIGVDGDQGASPALSDAQKATIITSMLKRVDTATFDFITSVVDGKPLSGFSTFALADDGVGYSTTGNRLTAETIAQLEDYKAQIIAGDIKVPEKP